LFITDLTNKRRRFCGAPKECRAVRQHIARQKISEQIEAINLLELEMKAGELLPQMAYDYYATGAHDEVKPRER
jgi:hypothetical protein